MCSIITAVLLIAAVVLLLGLTPERITDDIMKIASPKKSLADISNTVKEKKKRRKIAIFLINTRNAGKEDSGHSFTFS